MFLFKVAEQSKSCRSFRRWPLRELGRDSYSSKRLATLDGFRYHRQTIGVCVGMIPAPRFLYSPFSCQSRPHEKDRKRDRDPPYEPTVEWFPINTKPVSWRTARKRKHHFGVELRGVVSWRLRVKMHIRDQPHFKDDRHDNCTRPRRLISVPPGKPGPILCGDRCLGHVSASIV